MKTKLMGSAPDVQSLITLMEQKLYWTNITFDLVTGIVSLKGKPIDGVRVVKRKNRNRLEFIEVTK